MASCKSPDPSLIGTWKGSRDWKKLNIADDSIAMEFARITLELKDGGKFRLTSGGIPFDGQWTRQGDKLNFEVWLVLNRKIEAQSPDMKSTASGFSAVVAKDKIVLTEAYDPKSPVELTRQFADK